MSGLGRGGRPLDADKRFVTPRQEETENMRHLSGRQRVGIEKIWAYPCSSAVDFADIARARGDAPEHPTEVLMMDKRGVNPTWEDAVTMGVNAAEPMLSEEDRRSVEMLVVGTESSGDQGKPISTFMHRFLRLTENSRNFETKHACYGGTCALMTAAHWVASGVAGDAKALVIASDQSRANIGETYEYVMGAGAVAMLVSNQPAVLELELESNGYWTKEVGDTFRPTSTAEAGNTDESLYCYQEALDGAYEHFKRKNNFEYKDYFQKHVYHVPFSAMAERAHRAIMRREYGMNRKQAKLSFDEKVRDSLSYSRQFGGIYTAAVYICAMGALNEGRELIAGDRMSIFSYGSGSGSEFYSTRIGPESRARVRKADLQGLIDSRRLLTVDEYETIERERTTHVDNGTYVPNFDAGGDLYASHYAGKKKLILKNVTGHFRTYDWS